MYKRKLLSKHSSILWKFSFQFMKHIQKLFFLFLFIKGTQNIKKLDSMINLINILMFTVYITWEHLYRSCSMLPGLFISNFIITRYYYDLHYYVFERNDDVNSWCGWMGMVEPTQIPDWKMNSSVYFRVNP